MAALTGMAAARHLRGAHLRLVGAPAESPDRHARTDAQNRARRRAALQARTRGGLDGLGIAEIETALTHHRQHTGGAAAGSDEAADLHAVQCAYEEVVAWMVENNVGVYHGQLR